MDDKPVALASLTSFPAAAGASLAGSPEPPDAATSSTAARSDDLDDEDEVLDKAYSKDEKSVIAGGPAAPASGGLWRLKNLDNGIGGKTTTDEPAEPPRRRSWHDRLLRRRRPPPLPAPASLDDAALTPLASASFLSLLTFSWITPLMDLGYRRTLQATECVVCAYASTPHARRALTRLRLPDPTPPASGRWT